MPTPCPCSLDLLILALLVVCLLQLSVAGYCRLAKPEYTAHVKFIREGFEKRVSEVPGVFVSVDSKIVSAVHRGAQW